MVDERSACTDEPWLPNVTGSATNCANSCNGMRMCVKSFQLNCWFNRGYQWLQQVWILKLWGKIGGRHISITALSEYHVDYMNRKGWYSVIMQGEPFHRCDAWTRAWRQGSGKL